MAMNGSSPAGMRPVRAVPAHCLPMPTRGHETRPMKHLFLVHSYITCLVARQVVAREGLSPEDVAFLTTRNFTPQDLPYPQARAAQTPRIKGSMAHRIRLGWQVVKTQDRLVHQLTGGESFHLYTPQTMERYIQIIRSNPGCTGFSYLEEGLNSYCTRAEIERTHPPTEPGLKEKITYRFRVRESRFFDDGYSRVYGVSNEVFPDLSNRVVLENVFAKPVDTRLASVENILALDALTIHRRIRLESLLVALRRLGMHLSSGGVTQIHYKLHPAQIESGEGDRIRTTLHEGGVRAVQLPDQVCLEELAYARPDIRYFVNLSSVGLYASLQGCTVFSYANWVAQAEPGFTRYIELTPAVFRDHVEFFPA